MPTSLNKKPPANKEEAEPEIVEFHFNPITPEDWRANEAPLADLYQRKVVSAEYVRDRLNIPPEAGKGTMAPDPTIQPRPLPDEKPGERWRLRMGNGRR